MKSKKEVEYAARFIDYDQRNAFEAALKQSSETMQMNRKSISSLFNKRQPIPIPRPEFKKEEEVTDIIDDWTDIMAQPLGQSVTREPVQKQPGNLSARPVWGNSRPVMSNTLEEFKGMMDDGAE